MYTNEKLLQNKKIIFATLIFAVITASLLFSAGFYYNDLYCDGGWYSYPALAVSRGGSPAENLKQINDVETMHGVKSLFHHNTSYTIRIIYTSLWFKYISQNIFSLKILSFLELLIFLALTFNIIYIFSEDITVSLLLLALLINDKRLISIATSDYRPDIMVGIFLCISFLLLLWENRALSLIFGSIFSCLLILVHVTAVIPFISMICFFLFYNAFCGNYSFRDNYKYLLVTGITFLVFLCRDEIFYSLFCLYDHILLPSAKIDHNISIMNPAARYKLLTVLSKGILYQIKKEVWRWQRYFIFCNISELLTFLTGLILFFRQFHFQYSKNKKCFALFCSTIMGLIAFAVLDPHTTWRHAIAFIPFFFFLLACILKSARETSLKFIYILIALIWISGLHSITTASQLVFQGEKGGYNIVSTTKYFNELMNRKSHSYIIVGPTEIWPFVKKDRNVLIIDIRNGKQFKKIEPVINSIDYIVINKDYAAWRWKKAFLKYFPDYSLELELHLQGHRVLLEIYKLKKKDNIKS